MNGGHDLGNAIVLGAMHTDLGRAQLYATTGDDGSTRFYFKLDGCHAVHVWMGAIHDEAFHRFYGYRAGV